MDRVSKQEHKRSFDNMQGALLDIMQALEHEYDLEFVKSLRLRVENSKTKEELRLIMDGLLTIAGFAGPQV